MGDKNKPYTNRRKVLKLLGSGATAGIVLSSVGGAAAASNKHSSTTLSPTQQKAVTATLQEKANNYIQKNQPNSTVTTEGFPSWLPTIPSALPFNWCVKGIPDVPNFCASTTAQGWGEVSCNGYTFYGPHVSQDFGKGPEVKISSGNVEVSKGFEASMELALDPVTECPYMRFSTNGAEACVGGGYCLTYEPSTVSATKLANDLWNKNKQLIKEALGLVGVGASAWLVTTLDVTVTAAEILAFG
ncbi:hypothetical protein [Halarchaeum nitratireducens]|uniref:Uncharacterized protein n=1 Tax=Halarchaeum nitratireducens TaxID=489913 RepID=A0A830G9C9_9EURY|nr:MULTISPECIES: hypothetical protein [Halarchaeum]MBP2249829.1 hypothetical protein [Halarchaeum solikamskense]GGN10301.1 hypothetical protein GCM10009021_07630 [Halarchaeum nitratireducens]